MKKNVVIVAITILISTSILIGHNYFSNLKRIQFVKNFYSSLELSQEQNEIDQQEGGVTFDILRFCSCLDNNSIYSEKRVESLIGPYHSKFNIKLVSIDSVKFVNDKYNIHTTVQYDVYEMASFYSNELLIIQSLGTPKLLGWYDVKINKIVNYSEDLYGKFDENNFYKLMGRVRESAINNNQSMVKNICNYEEIKEEIPDIKIGRDKCRTAVIMHCTNLDKHANHNYLTQFCEYNGNGTYLIQLYDITLERDLAYIVEVDDNCEILSIR